MVVLAKKNFLQKRSVRIAVGVVVALVVLFFLLRSCTSSSSDIDKIYRIARDPAFSPLNLKGRGRFVDAFTNELLNLIAKEEGLEYALYDARSSDLLPDLNRGRYDAIITSIDPSPIIRARYLYSYPFYLTGPVVIVPVDSTITSFEQLAGKTVGVRTGAQLVFRAQGLTTILFRIYSNIRVAFDSLLADQIDAVIMDVLPAYAIMESFFRGQLRILGAPLTDAGLRLITLNDPLSQVLIEEFNEGLQEALEDGTYREVVGKWGLLDTLEMGNHSLSLH